MRNIFASYTRDVKKSQFKRVGRSRRFKQGGKRGNIEVMENRNNIEKKKSYIKTVV